MYSKLNCFLLYLVLTEISYYLQLFFLSANMYWHWQKQFRTISLHLHVFGLTRQHWNLMLSQLLMNVAQSSSDECSCLSIYRKIQKTSPCSSYKWTVVSAQDKKLTYFTGWLVNEFMEMSTYISLFQHAKQGKHLFIFALQPIKYFCLCLWIPSMLCAASQTCR